jgi:hypothetical protein
MIVIVLCWGRALVFFRNFEVNGGVLRAKHAIQRGI